MVRVGHLFVATLAVVALAGCSANPSSVEPSAASVEVEDIAMPTVMPEPEPEPEPEPTAPAVGSTVTTADEVTAAQDAGLGVFVALDGTQLVIDPAAPAPQVILDEARASGLGPVASPDKATRLPMDAALESVSDRAAAAGKKLVFIVQTGTYGDWDDDDLKSTHYAAVLFHRELQTGPQGKSATPQDARDKAQERIDAQPDPGQYEIVDLTT